MLRSMSRQHLRAQRVVVDDQHAPPAQVGAGTRRCARLSAALPRRAVNQKVLPCPGALSTPTSPPISSARLLADGEAEPRAAVLPRGGGVGLREGLEQLADLLGREADAGVLHLEAQRRPPLALAPPCGRGRRSSPFSVNLTAFVGEVDQDLPQPQRVAHAGRCGTSGSTSTISSRPFGARLLAR